MPNIIRKILIVLLIALVVIQLIPIDRSVPETSDSKDFIYATDPTDEVVVILKTACYDCHSYETRYPWYARVAPVKFWLQDHVEDGRRHLNFSEWADYDTDRQQHKLEELIEEVEERHMPLDSYTWMHKDARLTDNQIQTLINWVNPMITEK